MRSNIYLDSSAFSSLCCPWLFKQTVVEGRVPISGGLSDNYKVAYGTAFHLFIADYHRYGNKDQAIAKALTHYSKIQVPEKDYRTLDHLAQVCHNYLDTYISDYLIPVRNTQGIPMVEHTFKFPVYEDSDLVLWLFGKMDLVCNYDGLILVVDHKTTAAFSPAAYLEDYLLSSQMMLYCWALGKMSKQAGLPANWHSPMAVIDGIFLQKPSTRTATNPPARFLRSQIMDYTTTMPLFEDLLSRTVATIVHYHKNGFPKLGIINKSCLGKWGTPCMFHRACKAHDLHTESLILDGDFNIVSYDPQRLEEND